MPIKEFDLKCQSIFDGEVVVVHEGRSNFSELQADLALGRQDRLVFYAERNPSFIARSV